MALPPPANLNATHLTFAVLPDEPEIPDTDISANAIVHYTRIIDQVDNRLEILEAWQFFDFGLPEPEEPATLQELVQAARKRLRSDGIRSGTEELDARKWVLETVSAELTL